MTTLTRTDGFSERTLHRLVTWTVVALAVLLVGFTAFYVLTQRAMHDQPTLADRQVSAAEAAVKDSPQNIQDRLRLAAAYQQADRTDDAVAQYEEVLKAVPSNATAMLGLGSVKLDQGDIEGAKAMFTKLVGSATTTEFARVDPTLEAAHYFLGKIAVQQSSWEEAVSQLNSAVAMDKSDADAWYLLGVAQSGKGQDEKAVQSLSQALAFVPTGWCDPYGALQKAYTNLEQPEMASYASAMGEWCGGKTDSAVTALTALTQGPAKVPALLGLGVIAEAGSDNPGAANWYRQALKASPGNAQATLGLGRVTSPGAAGAAAGTTNATTTQAKAK